MGRGHGELRWGCCPQGPEVSIGKRGLKSPRLVGKGASELSPAAEGTTALNRSHEQMWGWRREEAGGVLGPKGSQAK